MRIWILIGALALLSSCANNVAPVTDGPRASITLKDGTTLMGMVVSSTPAELRVVADDKTTRIVAVNQIRTIQYADTAAAPAATTPPVAAPAPIMPATAKPAVVAPVTIHEHHHAPESAVTTKTNILAVGTEIQVRSEETIDSSKAAEGQTFAAEVAGDVRDAESDLVIPRGANATIVIKSMSKGGRFKGQSDLVLDMKTVSIDGRLYTIDTADLQKLGKQGVGANRRTAEHAGAGAAVGAIIGAIAGSGKGAAIGAGAGAGAGVLTQVLTRGSTIKVPVETVMTFKLDRPLRVAAVN